MAHDDLPDVTIDVNRFGTLGGGPPQTVSPWNRIRIARGDEVALDVVVRHGDHEGDLVIEIYSPSGRLRILPSASNTIRVAVNHPFTDYTKGTFR